MRRVWLHNIGVFEIIPNFGNGSCLFQAISQALTFTTEHHSKIRSVVVEHMTNSKWSEKLHQLPDFWKHKIITQWLYKERNSFVEQNGSTSPSNSFPAFLRCCIFKCFHSFIERRRRRKYHRIKGLLQRKNKQYPQYLEDFKFVFSKFMLKVDEPATRFELEAAADRFRFHFDYLQTIPITTKVPDIQSQSQINLTNREEDILNNNVIDVNEGDTTKAPVDDIDKINDNKKTTVPVKMAMYQFHSCRNRGCKLSRSTPSYEHFYFLHSPLTVSNDAKYRKTGSVGKNASQLSLLTSDDCDWHWELLIPILLRKNPMPLNRRVFGLTYEIDESARKFITTPSGERREAQDKVAEAIDMFVQKNPDIIPPEDSHWPADDVDDYSGCAKALIDSCYYVNVEEEERYCSSSRRVVRNRETIMKSVNERSNLHSVPSTNTNLSSILVDKKEQ